MSDFNRGSEWRKWDLHVHTKDTNKNDQFTSKTFDDFCNTMFRKALDNNIVVIGITDYFSIENYKRVVLYIGNLENNAFFEIDEKEQIKQITLIPNIELRLLPSTGSGRLINIHCLFNPEYVAKLENDFFSAIEFSHGTRKYRMNRNDFINLGKAMGETEDEPARKKGIDNFVVSHSELQKILAENAEFRNNTIIVTSNKSTDGASGMQQHYDLFDNEQNSSLDATRQAIYKLTDMIFSSNKSDIEYFLGLKNDKKEDVIKKCGSLKPCIHGSDAHIESKLFNPDNNRHCWIKANPTFEGLKQIIYEHSRVYIGENKPQEPIYKLESINLKFNENTKWDKDEFCFAKDREPILFSPYFNCIIGGRGSGKSTFVNLIAHKTGHQDKVKTFFKDLKIDNNITLNPAYLDNIEFIAQSDIDRFAKDTNEFTNAIFTRLDKLSNSVLRTKETEITNSFVDIDNQIDRLKKRVELHNSLLNLRNSLRKHNNTIKTFQDESYITSKKKLDDTLKELSTIEKSRLKYKTLYELVENIIKENKKIDDDSVTNEYDDFYNDLLAKLNLLFDETKKLDYSKVKDKFESIKKSKEDSSSEIKDYLISKGLTEDSLNDVSNAHQNIETTKNAIQNTLYELSTIKQEIKKFSFTDFDIRDLAFSVLINTEIEKINSKFSEIQRKNPDDVKLISVNFNINENIVTEAVNMLIEKLGITQKISGVRASFFDYITRGTDITNIMNQTHVNFFEELNTKTNTNTTTYKLVDEMLNNELNFNIYKLLLKKAQYDIEKNKVLKVLYDNKSLEKSSYGQRCTTALIILISLGNNPIIIDEPEAHLDSSLIANYLVELIKSMKKHRQIIFATHNANFVLNGDAELIIKLKNTDNFSTFDSFTIEDITYRHDLLQLEGGIEAFQNREKKYNIS